MLGFVFCRFIIVKKRLWKTEIISTLHLGIDNLNDIGCFGLTELGYGNNAVEMETTAEYCKVCYSIYMFVLGKKLLYLPNFAFVFHVEVCY